MSGHARCGATCPGLHGGPLTNSAYSTKSVDFKVLNKKPIINLFTRARHVQLHQEHYILSTTMEIHCIENILLRKPATATVMVIQHHQTRITKYTAVSTVEVDFQTGNITFRRAWLWRLLGLINPPLGVNRT